MDELFKDIAKIIASNYSLPQTKIHMSSRLYEDIGISYDQMLTFSEKIEEKIQLLLNLNEFLSCRTVGDIVAMVYQTQTIENSKKDKKYASK